MAEAVGVASGLLALSSFAFQSAITLHNTIKSFQNHTQDARDLLEELTALNEVLRSLNDTANTTTDVDLSALELPLRRCGSACKDFELVILKCSSQSGGGRASFRGWAKLRFMGEGIDKFRQMLATYKSTILIALTDANLQVPLSLGIPPNCADPVLV